jgi:hypothetical protein
MQTQQSLSRKTQEPVMNKSDKPTKQSTQDFVPMSAQQQQDEAVLAFLSNTPDAPTKTSQPSFAEGSKGLLELKKDLQQRGMSDAEAEEHLRTL